VLPALPATCCDTTLTVVESLASIASGEISATDPPSPLLNDASATVHSVNSAVIRLVMLVASSVSFQVSSVLQPVRALNLFFMVLKILIRALFSGPRCG
jgi:hypothetical protein